MARLATDAAQTEERWNPKVNAGRSGAEMAEGSQVIAVVKKLADGNGPQDISWESDTLSMNDVDMGVKHRIHITDEWHDETRHVAEASRRERKDFGPTVGDEDGRAEVSEGEKGDFDLNVNASRVEFHMAEVRDRVKEDLRPEMNAGSGPLETHGALGKNLEMNMNAAKSCVVSGRNEQVTSVSIACMGSQPMRSWSMRTRLTMS